jgi:hypothetical protein
MFHRLVGGQFTLKLMLLVVAFASVCAAFVSSHIDRQRRALAALRDAHAVVLFDYQETSGDFDPSLRPSAPAWLRRSVGEDYLGSIVLVRVRPESVNDDLLRAIGAVGTIKHLMLSGARLSQSSADAIASMKSLRSLSLDGTDASDSGVATIATLPRLEYLDLSDTLVTNATLAALNGRQHLRELDLSGTYVTAECVTSFCQTNPSVDVNFAYARRAEKAAGGF